MFRAICVNLINEAKDVWRGRGDVEGKAKTDYTDY